MKAVTVNRYKQSLRVSDVAEPPKPQAGEVTIEVLAAGLNPLDEKIRRGEFRQLLPYRTPFVLGHDVAGVITDIGHGVANFAPGDIVFGRLRDGGIGSFTERLVASTDDIARVPESLSAVEAASLPLVALTAWQTLVEIGKVKPGHKVLIHGGAGGLGSVAIQLAKYLGAYVATTASPRNTDLLHALGADEVIDYTTQDFAQVLSGYDMVLDSLGADSVKRSLRVVKPGGHVVGVSGPPTPDFAKAAGAPAILRLAIAALSRSTLRAAKAQGAHYTFHLMHASGPQLAQIASVVDRGAIKPIVSRTVELEEIPDALSNTSSGSRHGKVVAVIGAVGIK